MNKSELLLKATRLFNTAKFNVVKASPEILAVVGTSAIIGGTIMACKATTKAGAIKAKMAEDMDAIQYCIENADNIEEGYTQEDAKKDTVSVYAQTGMAYAKLYAPAVLTTLGGIVLMWKGHSILSKRNAAITTAYIALDKGFKQYRGRVIERFGKDLDYELRHNIKAKEIEETTVLEDGTEVVDKKIVNTVNPNDISIYAKFFDEISPAFKKDAEANLIFLRQQQVAANEKLKRQGHLCLNEVHDLLGLPRTKYGWDIGWVYDLKNPVGDNFVDFGIYKDVNDEAKRLFVNGKERVILLDFNVDGPINGKVYNEELGYNFA